MDYIVLGGDARMEAVASLLQRRGHVARFVSEAQVARALIPGAGNIVTNCPSRLDMHIEEILSLAASEARIFLCGPAVFRGDPRCVDLWADEALLQENARLTAEGALAAAMAAGDRSLRGMSCAVIGWGRIGSALAQLLVALGARVTVVSRAPEHRALAVEAGAKAVPLTSFFEAMSDARLIFSTPPARVLDAEALRRVSKEAMVIDLASPPYGVDLEAAWRLGLRAWREPGLPGRYCPESAAEALLEAMARGRDFHA